MKENNALDFDDLLYITTKLLSIETIRKRWQDRFHYILIDEYQDTNHAQYALTKILAAQWRNICVSAMPTRVSTPGAVPTSATSSTLPGTIPTQRRSSSNRITARPRPS